MSDAPRKSLLELANADTAQVLRRLFRDHGRKHLHSYVVAMLLMSVGAGATAWSAYLLKPVLNGLIEGEHFKDMRYMAWLVFGLFAARGLVTYLAAIVLSRAGNAIIAAAQGRLFEHLLRQDLRFFADRHSSDFITRIVYAPNGVRDTIQALITSLGRDVLTLLGLVAVMFVQDARLALIAVAGVPVAAVILSRTVGRMRKFMRRSYVGSAQIMETMQETVHGARIVKSFNLEDIMRARMAVAIREVERASNRVQAGLAISNPVADTLAGLAIGLVIFYGSWRVSVAEADAGSFFSFVAAMLMAYDPAKRLARLKLDIQNGVTSARLMYEVLETPAAETRTPGLPGLKVAQGRIVLENIRFRYRPDEMVLDGLDLVIEPSQTTALVGPSGGGKSTVIALIQRFYAPESGRISIDGQDIAGLDLASLRDSIAFVSQDVYLFRGTIRENIALGKLGATQDEIVAAAQKAHAHDFIMGFSSGYDTQVGEQGAQLSGGQKQRISIARAILKDAPILLLDEPTAALDSESEREVQRALDDLRIGRTTLVVAHRLQTIINADRIHVVANGKAAESGAHDELIRRGGAYRSFFASQFGDSLEVVRPASSEAR
ncbi:MAG: transporter ATP-binding protein [Hyphomicrobiales bacterium]|nr:transporter ATP-binding protein [Hyphomicrobiales bacterium]